MYSRRVSAPLETRVCWADLTITVVVMALLTGPPISLLVSPEMGVSKIFSKFSWAVLDGDMGSVMFCSNRPQDSTIVTCSGPKVGRSDPTVGFWDGICDGASELVELDTDGFVLADMPVVGLKEAEGIKLGEVEPNTAGAEVSPTGAPGVVEVCLTGDPVGGEARWTGDSVGLELGSLRGG